LPPWGWRVFSPTLAAFYFTFVDPAGLFSSALGLMLYAFVAVINYAFRTDFYLAPHGFVNAVIIGLNMILAFLNIFFPKLTFRFARLTVNVDTPAWREYFKVVDDRIKNAQKVISSTTNDWENQPFENKMAVANHYWDLRIIANHMIFDDNDMEDILVRGHVSQESVAFFLRIIGDKGFLDRINTFDEENFRNLVALANLLSSYKSNAGLATVDLNRAQEGFRFIHEHLNEETGFRIHENLHGYLSRRFKNFKDGDIDPVLSTKNLDIVTEGGPNRRALVMRRMMWGQVIEISTRLLPAPVANRSDVHSNTDDLKTMVGAYYKFWEEFADEFPGLLREEINVQQERFTYFLRGLNLPPDMIQKASELLSTRTEVASFIAKQRDGVESVYEFADSIDKFNLGGRNLVNEYLYTGPLQIILKSIPCDEITVVWVFKGAHLPDKYRLVLGSSFNPETYYLATQRNDNGSLEVAKIDKDEVDLGYVPKYQKGRPIVNGKTDPLAFVSLNKGIVVIEVVMDEFVRFGVPLVTSIPEVSRKEFTFDLGENLPGGPVSISEDTKQSLSTQIQKYIGFLSSTKEDEKLLIKYFNQAARIVIQVRESQSQRRFRMTEDAQGVVIEIMIQENEIDTITSGGFFGNLEKEQIPGIGLLVKALGEQERILNANPFDYKKILGLNENDYDKNGHLIRKNVSAAKHRLHNLLHSDRGFVGLDHKAIGIVNTAAKALSVNSDGPADEIVNTSPKGLSYQPNQAGAIGIFEFMGIKNLTLIGVLESLVDLLLSVFYILPKLVGLDPTSPAEWGLAALDVTGSLVIILLVGKFLAHFLGGVIQPGGQEAKTLKNTPRGEMFVVALVATFTASKNLVMVPFLAVAFLAPISAWIAVPLAAVSVIWGTYLHAWSNYLVEVSHSKRIEAAEGVTVISYRVSAEGIQEPATMKGLLDRIFLGGPAAPAYESVDQAIHAVRLKDKNARVLANTGNLASATIERNPALWVANQALLLDENRQQEGVAFLNMVVFFSNHLLAMADQQPEGPLLIEVQSQEEFGGNPTAQMALAAAVMAHRELKTTIGERPLALIARGEGEGAWKSTDEIQTAVFNALEIYAPAMATDGTMATANVNYVHATGQLITMEGESFQFNLANILTQTFENKNYKSALVMGKEAHFNKEGIDMIIADYQALAERFANSMRGMILFLTAA
jgi:hypothetical protein